jgi:cytochrome c553
MMPLPRSPTRLGVRPALGAMLLMTACAAGAQQWTQGQMLWNANACIGCHGPTNNVPLALMQGNRYPSPTEGQAQALSALNNAIQSVGVMSPFSSLNLAQRTALSYFISNWRAEPNAMPLSGTTLQPNTETIVRLFNNGRATLQIAMNGGIVLTGPDATQFNVRGVNNTCFALNVLAGSSCDVAVRYQPTGAASASHRATLTFTHNAEPLNQSTVQFAGATSASPPAPAPSGGGGALSALWLALLPAALRRRRTA